MNQFTVEITVSTPEGIREADVRRCLQASLEDKGWKGKVESRSRVAQLEAELAKIRVNLR